MATFFLPPLWWLELGGDANGSSEPLLRFEQRGGGAVGGMVMLVTRARLERADLSKMLLLKHDSDKLAIQITHCDDG